MNEKFLTKWQELMKEKALSSLVIATVRFLSRTSFLWRLNEIIWTLPPCSESFTTIKTISKIVMKIPNCRDAGFCSFPVHFGKCPGRSSHPIVPWLFISLMIWLTACLLDLILVYVLIKRVFMNSWHTGGLRKVVIRMSLCQVSGSINHCSFL